MRRTSHVSRRPLASVGAVAIATAFGLSAAPLAATSLPAAVSAGGPLVRVIIQYKPAGAPLAEAAVNRLGGHIAQRLDAVEQLTAELPQRAVATLRAAAGVTEVTADSRLTAKGGSYGGGGGGFGGGGYGGGSWNTDNGQQNNSLFNIGTSSGIHSVWQMYDSRGQTITGKGVGVALIDSGIAPVTGLSDPAKVINGPDLSFESQAPNLRYLDTFGHGTHMAGIIAGRDPDTQYGWSSNDPSRFDGVAPDARLINMKVAAADGATDVSQVIAAIDWTVAHRNDAGLNIRVINLSYGTDSAQDPKVDPLSHAVEAAWRKGIVVVAAVGNEGDSVNHIAMPAQNPYVIAVGAADPNGTTSTTDDVVATFSSRGNTTRHADLLAPGRSVVSLRAPGSFIDVNYPTGLVPGDTTGRYFRGSGTSQATAVMSGAAALLLQQRPTLTPDQVKRLLVSTAAALPNADPVGSGAGELNLLAAAKATTPSYTQTFPATTGLGSIELSRGTSHVADPSNGVELRGEQDIMGHAWVGPTWAPAASAATAWSGGTWNGSVWAGTGWTGSSWAGRTWSATAWAGRTWSGVAWSGRTWSNATWNGRTWSGRTWSGRTWSGSTWSGRTWCSGL
jgi:serine protease AprX